MANTITLDMDLTPLKQKHISQYFDLMAEEDSKGHLFALRTSAVKCARTAGWFGSDTINYVNGESEGSIDIGADVGEFDENQAKALQAVGAWVGQKASDVLSVDPK